MGEWPVESRLALLVRAVVSLAVAWAVVTGKLGAQAQVALVLALFRPWRL